VIAKRLKYGRPVYRGDSNHFHHRFHRIGFSQRRTVAYLYVWSITMAGVAVALRFVPYSDHSGHLNSGWALLMGVLLVLAVATSAYLVYVLELVKLRRLRSWQLRRTDPSADERQIEAQVDHEIETGEFSALS
jgi:UDP-GlcNAc:undecaprenyl-phosphate GlcNAc-1-phosphate transferase